MLREKKGKDRIVPEKNTDAWDVFPPGEDNLSGTISVFFLYKITSKPFEFGQRLVVPLRKISANAGSGARGTRIELKLNQLTYVGETTPITGSRIQHLQIISHLGSRRAPLHVGFVGSNRILNDGSPNLNDGSPNTLVLQLMNVLKSEGDTSVTLTKESEFLISFDVQSASEYAPWSLCTEDEIKGVKGSVIVAMTDGRNVVIDQNLNPVSDVGRWKVDSTGHGQGETPVWSIKPLQDIVLGHDDYIQIYISNIKTSLPSGLTNLYLDYRHIPGFWDGQVVCPIEKAPLLFYDVTRASHVPQVQDAIAAMENDRQRMEPLIAAMKQERLEKPQVAWAYGHLDLDRMEAALVGIQNDLALARNQPQYYYTQMRVGIGCVKPKAKLEIALSAKDADTKPLVIRKEDVNYLTVLKDGYVGIGKGKEEPKASLDVNGEIRANYFRAFEGATERFSVGSDVLINSKVGIGTSSPGAKLSIMGGLHVGGESDPGDKNLLVDGKATIVGGLHVGGGSYGSDTPIGVRLVVGDKNLFVNGNATIMGGRHIGVEGDPFKVDIISSNLVVNGSALFFGRLDVVSQIRFMHRPAKHFVADINVASVLDSKNYYLVFRTSRDAQIHESMTVQAPGGGAPTLSVAGPISEQLDVIDAEGRDDWDKSGNHAIMKYFSQRLSGKPVGTMLRAITNHRDWKGYYWKGWVDADRKIRVDSNHRNTPYIAPQKPTGGGG